MTAHARLSPSSAHRWMTCPGSIRLSESLPSQDTSNEASREGTFAHSVAEILASLRLGLTDFDSGHDALNALENEVVLNDFDFDEMYGHGLDWAARLREMQQSGLTVEVERKVATGVPQSWGTADCIAFREDFVNITDYKYGKGVRVDAPGNPQLRMYGLGVLERFAPKATHVEMSIWQPRIGHYSTDVMTAQELRDWRDAEAIPAARLALTSDAPIVPSEEACRFCPAAGVCSIRTEVMLNRDFGTPEVMTPAALAEAMDALDFIEDWITSIRTAALQVVNRGETVPGYKLVRKRGQRKIVDPDRAIEILGPESIRHSIRPLGELEKLVGGRKILDTKLGDIIQMSVGGTVLVPESDPRPVADPGDDFA